MIQETQRCPCCDSAHINSFTKLTVPTAKGQTCLPLLRCPRCRHAWLDTGDVHHVIEEDYAHDYIGHRVDAFFENQCRMAIDAEIGPLCPAPANLLDVGCGNGGFLLAAQEAGYDGLGVDISAQAVDLVNRRGGKAIAVDFLSHDFGRSFDVITMWDVVEHLKDPYQFFLRARQLLRPGGILVIKTPGVGGIPLWLARLRNEWAGGLLQAPHHVQYWSSQSMDAILHRTGFNEVLHWKPRQFRSVPKAKSLGRKVRRLVRNMLLRGTGSVNVFCAGRAT